MAPNSSIRERIDPAADTDPRDLPQAEVIDLATRSVLPTVSQRKRGDGMGMVAGVLIVAALGGVTLWSMDAARNPESAKDAAAEEAPAVPAEAVTMPAPHVEPMPAPAPAELAAPAPQPVLAAPPAADAAAAPEAGRYANPTIVYDASGGPAPEVPGEGTGAKAEGTANDEFASRLGASGSQSATATRKFDPATTVTQGTLIPAVLETAINTDVPGYVRAIVSTDVRSFDGRRVLVPRSSRLVGQYKSGLSAGQKRAYVIWTRLIRPDGISVDLGSPAISFDGETGLAGKVNSHFFERFGSAILLSVVGGLSTLTGGGSSVIVSGGQSAASAAVQQSGSVAPTVRVRQGEPIRVFTARDLDFSQAQ